MKLQTRGLNYSTPTVSRIHSNLILPKKFKTSKHLIIVVTYSHVNNSIYMWLLNPFVHLSFIVISILYVISVLILLLFLSHTNHHIVFKCHLTYNHISSYMSTKKSFPDVSNHPVSNKFTLFHFVMKGNLNTQLIFHYIFIHLLDMSL